MSCDQCGLRPPRALYQPEGFSSIWCSWRCFRLWWSGEYQWWKEYRRG